MARAEGAREAEERVEEATPGWVNGWRQQRWRRSAGGRCERIHAGGTDAALNTEARRHQSTTVVNLSSA